VERKLRFLRKIYLEKRLGHRLTKGLCRTASDFLNQYLIPKWDFLIPGSNYVWNQNQNGFFLRTGKRFFIRV
jgi:hypothetical protein